ncbi:MAG: low molecular weight phosphatase family protein [Candidatus Acidiferrales bacterium]
MGTVPEPSADPKIPPRLGRQKRHRIAFVCLGNSCRSQMAEAWARHLSEGRVEAMSAGVRPLGFVALETIEVMSEKGISLDGHKSKGLDAIHWRQVDVLVNMSPYAAETFASAFTGRRLEWKVRDPFDESLDSFREVRDLLEKLVRKLLNELQGGASTPQSPPVT